MDCELERALLQEAETPGLSTLPVRHAHLLTTETRWPTRLGGSDYNNDLSHDHISLHAHASSDL